MRRKIVSSVLILVLLLLPLVGNVQVTNAQDEPPCEGWCALATFDDYANGSLRSQGTWHVNLPGAADGAQVTDDAPVVFSGKTMINQLDTGTTVKYRGNAYAELGNLAIENGSTGTLFFELLTTDASHTALNLGLSTNAAPGLGWDDSGNELDLNDYEVQLTLDDRGFVIRDGDEERVVDNVSFEDNKLYAIWMVIDNDADTYQVYIATDGQDPVIATSSGDDSFSFRNGTADPLVTYLHLNDPDDPPTADTYIDNIYLDPATTSLDNPSPAFDEIVTFDDYDKGELDGQDGWETSSPKVVVTEDPEISGNQVMDMSGPNFWSRRSVPEISSDDTGTLFFRVYRDGLVDTSHGLSATEDPTAFGDFEVQANNQNSTVLNARDGGRFAPAGVFSEGAWQCMWLVADNETDSYRMYSRGGPYPVTTRLPVDKETEFAFRNGTTEGLKQFFARNGGTSPGNLYIDDIAIDTGGINLRVPGGNPKSCTNVDESDLPILDPIPNEPIPSGLGLTLDEFTTIPASRDNPPTARINYLREIPDESGRLAVPDLYGTMYVIKDGEPIEYLDVAEKFPDFTSTPGLGTGFGFVTFHPEFVNNGIFYTVHTETGDALKTKTPDLPYPDNTRVHGVITEWTADDPSADKFHGTSREVLRIGYSTFLHGIQQIDFNPTAEPGDEDYGLLYIASGDGDEVPNFSDNPQDPGMPQGKLLRIDPQGKDGAGGGYGIPPTNPFVDNPDALEEVYAIGFRNPHRFSWDSEGDHRMFLGHIGEKRIDSIYEVKAGDNFGWNEREGSFRFKKSDPTNVYPLPDGDEKYGYTYPVAELENPRDVNAVVGGFVYRGDALPKLQGKYVFSDVVRGSIYYTNVEEMQRGGERANIYELDLFNSEGKAVTMLELAGGGSRVDFRFGQDADGELYFLSKQNGKIWKVTDAKRFAACEITGPVITDVMSEKDWDPVTPEKWEFPGFEVVLAEPGQMRPGPRRPFEYAVLKKGPFRSVQIDAEVKIDVPQPVGRDVIIVFGYQSDTEFYYVHLSEDNQNYAHNGIFVVNNGDRKRIDDQWGGSIGAPSAITDQEYHQVRVTHCADTGEIAVYMDGSEAPLMTATDTTFDSGRIGFGSFDDIGRIRNLTVTDSSSIVLSDVLKMVEEAEIKPHGIKRSILAKLQNAEKHFGKAQTFREAGKDKQAEHHENKGYKKLEKVIGYIDGRPEKEISSEVKKELLDALTFVIENRTMSK